MSTDPNGEQEIGHGEHAEADLSAGDAAEQAEEATAEDTTATGTNPE